MESFYMIQDDSTCPFCMERNGGTYQYYGRKVKKAFNSRMVLTNQLPALFFIPDLSPFKRGHVLICSDKHIQNYAALNEAVIYSRIDMAIQMLAINLTDDYELIFFEHGTNSCISHNGCVQHAHMHVMPIQTGVFKSVIELAHHFGEIRTNNFNKLEDEYHWLNSNSDSEHYVLFGNYKNGNSKQSIISLISNHVPSQLTRCLLSEVLKIPMQIDNEHQREDIFLQTINDLISLLSSTAVPTL